MPSYLSSHCLKLLIPEHTLERIIYNPGLACLLQHQTFLSASWLYLPTAGFFSYVVLLLSQVRQSLWLFRSSQVSVIHMTGSICLLRGGRTFLMSTVHSTQNRPILLAVLTLNTATHNQTTPWWAYCRIKINSFRHHGTVTIFVCCHCSIRW